jgi:hypothetical protein
VFHPPVRLARWTVPPRTSIVVIGDKEAEEAVRLISGAVCAASLERAVHRQTASA